MLHHFTKYHHSSLPVSIPEFCFIQKAWHWVCFKPGHCSSKWWSEDQKYPMASSYPTKANLGSAILLWALNCRCQEPLSPSHGRPSIGLQMYEITWNYCNGLPGYSLFRFLSWRTVMEPLLQRRQRSFHSAAFAKCQVNSIQVYSSNSFLLIAFPCFQFVL